MKVFANDKPKLNPDDFPPTSGDMLAQIEKAMQEEPTVTLTEKTGTLPPITWRDDLRVQELSETQGHQFEATGTFEQANPTPINVQRMCDALVTQWSKTADECEARAEALERVASELHHRATVLRNACGSLPQDIVEMVHHEIESSERALSTSDVNPHD